MCRNPKQPSFDFRTVLSSAAERCFEIRNLPFDIRKEPFGVRTTYRKAAPASADWSALSVRAVAGLIVVMDKYVMTGPTFCGVRSFDVRLDTFDFRSLQFEVRTFDIRFDRQCDRDSGSSKSLGYPLFVSRRRRDRTRPQGATDQCPQKYYWRYA